MAPNLLGWSKLLYFENVPMVSYLNEISKIGKSQLKFWSSFQNNW